MWRGGDVETWVEEDDICKRAADEKIGSRHIILRCAKPVGWRRLLRLEFQRANQPVAAGQAGNLRRL
jgi:hypothetical protein